MIERAFAARRDADARAADSSNPIPGGTWLRTPSLPDIWDLNVAMLGPAATDADVSAAAALDVRRITLFRDYDGPVPDGFTLIERSLLMVLEGVAPERPDGITELGPRSVDPAEDYAEQISEMYARQMAAGARRFGIEGTAWASVADGCVDDVFVVEASRGLGLGRAVTAAALAEGGWYLWCAADDPRPQGLYRSLGMVEAGRVAQLTRPG